MWGITLRNYPTEGLEDLFGEQPFVPGGTDK